MATSTVHSPIAYRVLANLPHIDAIRIVEIPGIAGTVLSVRHKNGKMFEVNMDGYELSAEMKRHIRYFDATGTLERFA